MDLIIVESPTKAKTLSRFLGKDYTITASMGHIRDLPESRLGIDTAADFLPEYVVSEKKTEKVRELKKLAGQADQVILATDPDREGEAISWHIMSLIGDKGKSKKAKGKTDSSSIKRITFHEITESAIKEALGHPREIDMNLVDAQQSRRILDRLVGYKLSPLLWKKVRRGLSAGRVQSVAVRLIVEREREIQAFKAVEYWEISVKLQNAECRVQNNEGAFVAKLLKIDGKNIEIGNQADAQNIVDDLKKQDFLVSQVIAKEVKRSPYPPFTTSTLQQAGSNVLGWSAKRTMQIAQSLYEQGLITYHRTDSTNLAAEAIVKVREFILSQYGPQFLPSEPKLYKTKSKVAQEAHEAIRPAGTQFSISNLQFSNNDDKKLYELIWNRYVACQMTEAISEQTSVDIVEGSKKYLLRANGSRVVFEGWTTLMQKSKVKSQNDDVDNNNESDEEKNNELPKLTVNDPLDLLSIDPSQHYTAPPPRFNEASLIKTLEEFGIGRPSTYAPIISTIQERQYVEKSEKKFMPTSLGFAVNDFLMTNFSNIIDYKFTAGMEDTLDSIANGEKKWIPMMHEFYDPFAAQLKQAEGTASRVKVEVEETDEKCPNDGAPLVVRLGKFGKFLACSNFPDCKFTKTYTTKANIKCPTCGGEILMKKTKNKKVFFGCANYPTCKFASWTKPKTEGEVTVVAA